MMQANSRKKNRLMKIINFALGIILLILFCSFKNKDADIIKTMKYLVYFDSGNYFSSQKEVDSILSTYKVIKLECEGFFDSECSVYKISINDSCSCNYYVAFAKETYGRLYKLRGFRNNDFLFFFNLVLTDMVGRHANKFFKDSQKARRDYIFKFITIEGLDLKEMYNHYFRNAKKLRNYGRDIYSCYKENYFVH
jgi:hypothetical protein